MKIILAQPRGFCAGVSRAVDVVEQVLKLEGKDIYVRHEVVHNRFVVNQLKQKGAIFVDELDDVPDDETVIFSAHGVSQAVKTEAEYRELKVFDATCPLVTKVHIQVKKASEQAKECILIGHKGHPEVEGTLGQYSNQKGKIHLVEDVGDVEVLQLENPDNVTFVTQTTLSMDETKDIITALRKKYPSIEAPKKEDICYATQNRQNAVRELAAQVDVVLVVGSVNSSNSNRLRELAEKCGTSAYLIDGPEDISSEWFEGTKAIGLTAGASAPEELVNQVISQLQKNFDCDEIEILDGIQEEVSFPLPKLLKSHLLKSNLLG
jgi:4-hydroxy-3-methylbut-2-enyl diphosphate reductase